MKRKSLSKQIRVLVLSRDEYRCRMCGRSSKEVSLEVDHILPVASGGTDELSNLATLCRDCNVGKSNYHFSNYMQIQIVPNNLEEKFRFCELASFGDYREFLLCCDYKTSIHPGGSDGSFEHRWRITGSDLGRSSDQNGLLERKKTEETKVFVEKIRLQLVEEGRSLGMTEEGLVKR